MSSTAILNKREILRMQSQRANLEHEANAAGVSAVADLLRERIAEIDRSIAWCQREIDSEVRDAYELTEQQSDVLEGRK